MKKKKNSKVDVAKRSVLFLQIGLIVVLFASWIGIEWKTTAMIHEDGISRVDTRWVEEVDAPIVIEEPEIKPEPKPEQAVETIEIVDDKKEVIEAIFEDTEGTDDPIPDPKTIIEIEEPEQPDVPFYQIENAPVFPGCENAGNNVQKKQCMSDKIKKLINKKFNAALGEQLGLQGVNRIYVQFKIDKKGDIVNVRARGLHPRLEKEAQRVVNALPKMKPGIQNHKPVGVTYTLPIAFRVE